MVFLSLLLFLLLWPPSFLVARQFINGIFSFSIILAIIIFGLCHFITRKILFVILSQKDISKTQFIDLIKSKGVKGIVFLTFLLSFLSLVLYLMENFKLDFVASTLLIIAASTFFDLLRPIPKIPQDILDMLSREREEELLIDMPQLVNVRPKPGIIYRDFIWSYKGKSYRIELEISPSVYERYKSKPRNLDIHRWAKEYVAGGITSEIKLLANKLTEARMPMGSYEEVDFVINFVQSVITYELDVDEAGNIIEYPKYPIETVVEGKGDCEDFSILSAAILKRMGYEVALLFLPGHAALGIAGAEGIKGVFKEHKGKKYYYVEMTAEGWKIGELPENFEPEDIVVSPVPSIILKA